jgi:hypothetical protein
MLLTPRQALRVSIVLVALVGLVAVPATPGFAGSGKATLSTSLLPSALTLSDASSGLVKYGLIKAIFVTGSSTATRAVLTVTMSQPVFFRIVTPTSTGCGPLDVLATTFTCGLDNVSGNTTVVRFVRFQSPDVSTCASSPCTLTATATLTYAESNGNQGGPTNDTLTDTSDIQLFAPGDKATADGGCITTFPATLGTLASLSTNQAAQVSYFAASPEAGVSFPCTAGAIGVRNLPASALANPPSSTPTLHLNQIWFADLQSSPQLATAVLTVFSLPSGLNASKFVLLELVDDDITKLFAVPACVNGGIPPGGPAIFPGVTYDSCVFSQGGFGRGGVSVTVKIRPFGDPGYTG